ncbi:MAG TPA: pyruvate dehydrogenase complex dihydrolipoamide acetyltransferase [Phycisphaerae bacterium]|nr:pyruvate dehydrogenase complex dihydrolipoamide acetyltransferase [Phycisphaerae bacterium]
MPIEITMPKLTDTMTEATLAKWLKKEGDKVNPGDMIAEVETDKATQELEAFEAGTVAKIVIPEGGKTPVGALIVVLAKPGEDAKQVAQNVKGGAPAAGKAPAPKAAATASAPSVSAASPSSSAETAVAVEDHHEGSEPEVLNAGRIRVSPLARKIADDRGIDLNTVRGTGPDGRIIKRDVLDAPRPISPAAKAAAPAPAAAKANGAVAAPIAAAKLEAKTIPLSNMRQTIARRLLQSKQTIPHFYVSVDVVMDKLLELRTQVNDQIAPEKLSVTDFIARAVALALARVPAMNSSFAETAIVQHGSVELGIAVALEDGLVVPVIKQAHAKGVRQISQEIKQLAELARAKKLKADQMTGSTFTISNLGMYGVKNFSAIVNPPESAILAVGGTTWQPVVKETGGKREVVPAQVMNLSLSADHRVVDGATGAKFLQELKTILEAPLTMLV